MRRRDVMGALGVLGAAPFAPAFAEQARRGIELDDSKIERMERISL